MGWEGSVNSDLERSQDPSNITAEIGQATGQYSWTRKYAKIAGSITAYSAKMCDWRFQRIGLLNVSSCFLLNCNISGIRIKAEFEYSFVEILSIKNLLTRILYEYFVTSTEWRWSVPKIACINNGSSILRNMDSHFRIDYRQTSHRPKCWVMFNTITLDVKGTNKPL